MADLEGKHIIVTGAGSGIGRATSILAAAQGADVLAVDVTEAVEETVGSIKADGGRAIAVQADVSNEESVAGFVRA